MSAQPAGTVRVRRSVLGSASPKRWPLWVNAYADYKGVKYGFTHESRERAERASGFAYQRPIYRIKVTRK